MKSSTKISRPRILRSTSTDGLTLDQVRGVAPAVFQEQAYGTLSDKYAYIPTHSVLTSMLDAGFTIHEVAQARPYRKERDPFAKHMLRLRHPAITKGKRSKIDLGEITPELVLVNAHDGSARYHLYAGLYRFICCNGLIVGDTFLSLVIAHRGGDLTRSRVLEGSFTVVNDTFPAVLQQYEQMRTTRITLHQQEQLAQHALNLRYPGVVAPFHYSQLLVARREQDQQENLWTIMNRIQENVMEGGFQSRSLMMQRVTNIRPVERVDSRVNVNRGLWSAAAALLPA